MEEPGPAADFIQREWLPHLGAWIRAYRLKIDRLFPVVRVPTVEEEGPRPMDPSLRCFLNVNPREALEAAVRLVADID